MKLCIIEFIKLLLKFRLYEIGEKMFLNYLASFFQKKATIIIVLHRKHCHV